VRDLSVEDAFELLIKSGFSLIVVKSVATTFGQLFDSTINITSADALWWRLEDELLACMGTVLSRNDFLFLAQLIPFFHDGIERFLLTTRRGAARDSPLGVVIDGMRKCSRQQLIALSGVFEDTLAFEYLFCASYCLSNIAKCIECLERQQRMTRCIDPAVLSAIGYIAR
jgi:hypothetical protein